MTTNQIATSSAESVQDEDSGRKPRTRNLRRFLGVVVATAALAVTAAIPARAQAMTLNPTLGNYSTCEADWPVDPGSWVSYTRHDLDGNGRRDAVLLKGQYANYVIVDSDEDGSYDTLYQPYRYQGWGRHIDVNDDRIVDYSWSFCFGWVIQGNPNVWVNSYLAWATQVA